MVSDVNAPLTGSVNLSIWSWDNGGTPVQTIVTPFTLTALDAKAVFSGSIAALTNGAPTRHFFVLTATASTVCGLDLGLEGRAVGARCSGNALGPHACSERRHLSPAERL